ncbi:MCE-family protein Mce1F [Pseudonocardia sp. Ae168_Ps1]|uniref:MCE family protein n=1 Tax=unclassified Pseudonocardia TaxID=2619320 RepID=UPI000965048F|nr:MULTISPECIES: MlaD family protein [unclassified Pseudonocardia]OLL73465.1 MCE-family protein Mce1F [Pseudonocardia sp. Ae150A_Ps1]OLL79441.1 MCE-family protein Mce1F [Pseudonocardia sp. Ae168_Ps1]OLL86424.1 MCE-family protein Mce1F [Pseudonocardia sp. Ae263_Ps1]OLL93535.1 MCE-family protein Mce1F [Pseudonocardia sp. Ae356_Ps1]
MITRFVKIQLVVFTVISLLAICTVVFGYAKVPTLLGYGRMSISADFPDGAGLYPNANVTYRGAKVGTVTGLALGEGGGVTATMSVDESADIPADTTAEIHSVSAIGEQYIDLVPPAAGGPVLAAGARIPMDKTSVPQQIAPVLDQTNRLLDSVPQDDLRTVVDEFHTAFQGSGPELRRILDGVNSLVGEADANYEPTRQLLNEVGPLLETQTATSGEIRNWTRDLALFSDTLRESDPALRNVVDKVPGAAAEVTQLFKDLQPTLPILLANLTTVNEVLATYNPSLEQILVIYPKITAMEQSVTDPRLDGLIGLNLKLNVNNSPQCTEGYQPYGSPEGPRQPFDLSGAPTATDSYCQLPQDDPGVARGARNLPCIEGVPGRRAASPEECRGDNGFTPTGTAPPVAGVPGGAVVTAPYDPASGQVLGADEPLFVVGGSGQATDGKERTWEDLMREPVTP